jgi:hypothetical protein
MELGDLEHPDETLEKCAQHLNLLRQLKDHAAWNLFCEYLNGSAEVLEQNILNTSCRTDMIYDQEFKKGSARILRQIPSFLDDYCETLYANIRRIQSMLKDDEDEPRDESFDYRVESAFDGANTSTSAP